MTARNETSGTRLLAFIHHEAAAGLLLVLAAAAAIAINNSEYFSPYYEAFLNLPVSVNLGSLSLAKPALLWINDGLMAIFFFLVGLEIKREVLEGNLSQRDQIVLPAMAAAGGMAAPAMVYLYFTADNPALQSGWAIPAATDIAFALGALSLAGNRVPVALKVFLLTLATLDDLGAIVIIALFYTSSLSTLSLVLAACAIAVLIVFNRLHVSRAALYIFVGFAMWVFVLKSGVHATLAGVALGLLIPLNRKGGSAFVHVLEEGLHPYVKFIILPLFAFGNAGIPLDGMSFASLLQPLPLAIAAGLVIGKPLGIMAAVGAARITGLARLPEGCTAGHMLGVSCLAGIGFTMSLFIGSLAFATAEHADAVRAGVMAGSILSTALGLCVLFAVGRKNA
jgi:Na+:H+ antiporter, NhaA family